MSLQETKKTTRLTDKFYEEMRKVVSNFKTNDREHMLIVSAISFVVKENLNTGDLEAEISRMKSALENIQETIDGNNVTPLLEDIYRNVNRGLGIGD